MKVSKPLSIIGLIIISVVFTFIVAITGADVVRSGNNPANVISNNLPDLQTGKIPWTPDTDNLKQRLEAIGLPVLTSEGTTLHTHQHLDIYINGNKYAVPADIGINENQGIISPIHTHDASGIIHVESPDVQNFTLGQFFDIWGVKFDDNCIGGYCNTADKSLTIIDNGKYVQNNFRNIILEQHDIITVIYGTQADVNKFKNTAYDFPAGY